MISEDVKQLFESQDIVAFATADSHGVPNAVPIYWKKIIDDKTIILIDNYMLKTKENLLANPNACISFWDANKNAGIKLVGKAKYHAAGSVFEKGVAWIKSVNPAKNPKGVAEFTVEEVYDISPGPQAGKRLK